MILIVRAELEPLQTNTVSGFINKLKLSQ